MLPVPCFPQNPNRNNHLSFLMIQPGCSGHPPIHLCIHHSEKKGMYCVGPCNEHPSLATNGTYLAHFFIIRRCGHFNNSLVKIRRKPVAFLMTMERTCPDAAFFSAKAASSTQIRITPGAIHCLSGIFTSSNVFIQTGSALADQLADDAEQFFHRFLAAIFLHRLAHAAFGVRGQDLDRNPIQR